MEYKIRNAKPEDITEIIELCSEHALFEKCEFERDGKAEKLTNFLFSEKPAIFCLIVENNQEILGYATYSFEFSTWNANFYTHMDCLYLRPQARNYGIGEKLIEEIAKITKLNGYEEIQWQTPKFNEKAIKFYQRIDASYKEKYRFNFKIKC